MKFRGEEFSTGTTGNFQPELISTSSLRFPELGLRRYRSSGRALIGRRMGCFFQDANCFELCHVLSGRASSWGGTNSA
jgi:hypothetical protein